MNTKKTEFAIVLLLFAVALIFLLYRIDFGLPGKYVFNGKPVPLWFPDEEWRVATIKYYLTPQAKMIIFSHPPLQDFLVCALLLKERISTGTLPPDWLISLISRCISAFSVALSAVLLYLIGKRFGRIAGIVAAIAFIIAPITSVVGKDGKPFALSGVFLLMAIHFSLRVVEDQSPERNYKYIGRFLGLAGMSSYLSAFFFHLPVLTYLFANKARTGDFLTRPNTGPSIAHHKRRPIVFMLVCMLFTVTFSLCLTFGKPFMFHFGELIYNAMFHQKPFHFHLNTINILYAQLKAFSLLLLFLQILLFLYYVMRQRLSRFTIFGGLAFWEISYKHLVLLIVVILALAAVLNPLSPLSLMKFIDNLHPEQASGPNGYYGLYAGPVSVPGYFSSIIPAAIGLPLYVLSAIGIIYVLMQGDLIKWLLLLTFAPFFLKLAAWNLTYYSASRYGFLAYFALYLSSGILLADALRSKALTVRLAGATLLVLVSVYTFLSTTGYLRSLDHHQDARVKAAQWILENLTEEDSIAISSDNDLPRCLGPVLNVCDVDKYRYADFPEYCVMDGFEFHVVNLYFQLTPSGYRYTMNDWWPSERPPTDYDLAIYDGMVNQRTYRLAAKICSSVPEVFGVAFDHRFLDDPAASYHKTVYLFERIDKARNKDQQCNSSLILSSP